MTKYIKLRHSVSFAFLLLSLNTFAQREHNVKQKTELGIIGGPNFTNAPLDSYIPSVSVWNSYTSSKYNVGFNIKAFVFIPISTKFALQPEAGFALYHQKQVYSNDPHLNVIGSVSINDKLSESAITFDALLKYKINLYSLSIGPQVEIVQTAKINTLTITNGFDNIGKINSERDFKKDGKLQNPVFSLLLGITKNEIFKNFGIGLYYRVGLSDFTKFYHIQQIGKISGFVLQFQYSF